jgi:type III secretory pathway component EscU
MHMVFSYWGRAESINLLDSLTNSSCSEEVEHLLYLMHLFQILQAVGFIKIGILWYTTINAVNTTDILIIIAESMMLFANNLKSINGNDDLFSMTTNRKLETSAASEKMIICINLFRIAFSKNWSVIRKWNYCNGYCYGYLLCLLSIEKAIFLNVLN